MGRLFGTDGVRGIANTELTAELAMNIGRAAAMVLVSDEVRHPTVLIGKDTRLSGDMIEGALIAGLCSVGANVELLGGIKIFSSEGYKLPDDLENRIEEIVLDHVIPYETESNENIGKVTVMENAADDYIEHVAKSVDCDLSGMEIALDCSNGSSSFTAEKLFTKLGAKVHMLFDTPDGININRDCGSTHIGKLQSYVREHKLCAGLAFDGDADRCLAVDENGSLIDGDFLMAICANDMKNRGVLKNNTVVGTVMTNMGFTKFCREKGLNFVPTKVGDRYVLEEMLQQGYNIGGEQSGHIIFTDFATTGDGELSGAILLSIMKRTGEKLSVLAKIMERMPQVLVNVKVSAQGKLSFYTDKEIKAEIKHISYILGERGRILIRVSGTEPLVRVMLEGESLEEIQNLAEEAAQVVRERLT